MLEGGNVALLPIEHVLNKINKINKRSQKRIIWPFVSYLFLIQIYGDGMNLNNITPSFKKLQRSKKFARKNFNALAFPYDASTIKVTLEPTNRAL